MVALFAAALFVIICLQLCIIATLLIKNDSQVLCLMDHICQHIWEKPWLLKMSLQNLRDKCHSMKEKERSGNFYTKVNRNKSIASRHQNQQCKLDWLTF